MKESFDSIEEKLNLLSGIGSEFKDLYFQYGNPIFKELSEKTFESKKILKDKVRELIELEI